MNRILDLNKISPEADTVYQGPVLNASSQSTSCSDHSSYSISC